MSFVIENRRIGPDRPPLVLEPKDAQLIELKAPVSGVISVANVRAGQVVTTRDTLFEIVDPGRLWIEELNEALDWHLPTKKDYETVAGLILAALGRIPRPGEQVTVGGYELAVVDADERRILKVKVRARGSAADTAAPRPEGGHSA